MYTLKLPHEFRAPTPDQQLVYGVFVQVCTCVQHTYAAGVVGIYIMSMLITA